jgi:5'-nucleotidase
MDPVAENPVVALVDIDGTLAGYHEELQRRLRRMASPGEPGSGFVNFDWDREPDYIKERMQVIRGNPGFWSKLPPLKDGFEILDALHSIGYSLHVLTKGPRYAPIAWMEKLSWCEQHIPYPHDITITMDKGLVYGRVLVDDYPDYANRWLRWRKRGTVIMPDRPWNRGFDHPQVYRYEGDLGALTTYLGALYANAKDAQRGGSEA